MKIDYEKTKHKIDDYFDNVTDEQFQRDLQSVLVTPTWDWAMLDNIDISWLWEDEYEWWTEF